MTGFPSLESIVFGPLAVSLALLGAAVCFTEHDKVGSKPLFTLWSVASFLYVVFYALAIVFEAVLSVVLSQDLASFVGYVLSFLTVFLVGDQVFEDSSS